ncbi:MAG: hypothetical protein L0Y71_07570 [Gemmataceae bacterium]|nr:hypothetical protein [Gemmataceae bacterium]
MFIATCLICVTSAATGQPKLVFSEGDVVVQRLSDFDREAKVPLVRTTLLIKGVHFASQFQGEGLRGNATDIHYRRLPVTYYHPRGPVGMAMQPLNWFSQPVDRGIADARLPASMIGQCVPISPFPQLAGLWSEPPFAVLGLQAGTMAAYARPLQNVDIYEEQSALVKLSVPTDGEPVFAYVRDAKQRGARIRIFEGPRRTMMHKIGVRSYYRLVIIETYNKSLEDTDTLLLTKQGMNALMDSVAPGGMLCYHVSNRYLNLTAVITDVAKSLGYSCKGGRCTSPVSFGQFTSRWVMVARSAKHLDCLREPEGLRNDPLRVIPPYWAVPQPTGRHCWTDEEVSFKGLRWEDQRK